MKTDTYQQLFLRVTSYISQTLINNIFKSNFAVFYIGYAITFLKYLINEYTLSLNNVCEYIPKIGK